MTARRRADDAVPSPRLHVASPAPLPRGGIDVEAAVRAAADLLVALGMVEHFSRALQVQARLTSQVAACLQTQLQPKGVGVVLEAEHLCMTLRGVQKPGAVTITSALHGLVRDDPRTREEFLSLTGGRDR